MKKTVVMGITGSIAAYKACAVVSALKKAGIDVRVILTRSGAEFITALSLETLSGNPVVTDMFNRDRPWEVEHIALAKAADLFLVAPASANFIGKAAYGIADDMLTTTILATRAPIVVAPAMNSNMYLNTAVQENIQKLKARGYTFIEPGSGMLACGDEGVGRFPEPESVVKSVLSMLRVRRDLEGRRILVTAGPTQERIDPVRYITNRSTGKMGYAIAETAAERGADVTLISGPVELAPPDGVRLLKITTSAELCDAVNREFESADALVMAAAPADFTPAEVSDIKIKKAKGEGMTLELCSTRDILMSIADKKGARRVMGFAAETNDVQANAEGKLERKNLDMIAANDVTQEGVGFGADTNAVTLYKRGGGSEKSGLMTKRDLASWLLDRLF